MKNAFLSISVSLLAAAHLAAAEPLPLLNLPGSGTDFEAIDYANLPKIPGTLSVIANAELSVEAINNFPPQKLPSGDWILTRRDARFNVSVLIGGRTSLSDWRVFPVVGIRDVPGFRPDEPVNWPLDDNKTLFALYRDNSGSQRLFHSTSTDLGKSWGTPIITNFPNSSRKLFSMQTRRGYRVMVVETNARRER